MNDACPLPLDRRTLLGLAGAVALAPAAQAIPGGTAGPADEARPGHAELLPRFAKAHARLDGKVAFWISRGREYGFVEGRYEQIYERHVISATRALLLPGGGLKSSYCEAAYATAPGDIESKPELPSPFTGTLYPNPLIRPLKMTWHVTPDGIVSARVQTATVQAAYDGRLDTQLGPDGVPLVDCSVRISTHRGEKSMSLVELGPYAADWQAERGGFVPARRVVTVYRVLAPGMAGGAAGVMLGVHSSRKHATLDGLRAALTASERRLFAEWFERWESMSYAADDFLMTPGT